MQLMVKQNVLQSGGNMWQFIMRTYGVNYCYIRQYGTVRYYITIRYQSGNMSGELIVSHGKIRHKQA